MVNGIIRNKISQKGGVGGADDDSALKTALKWIEGTIDSGQPAIKVIGNQYNDRVNLLNVIPRMLLFWFSAILIVLEVLLSIIWGIPWGIGEWIKSWTESWIMPKEVYFWLYGLFKFIFIIIVLVCLAFVGNRLYDLSPGIKKYDYPILLLKALKESVCSGIPFPGLYSNIRTKQVFGSNPSSLKLSTPTIFFSV